MNLWLRLLYEKLTWRLRTKESWFAVGRRTYRVWPSDLDVFNHMNNGVYLTLMDLSRYDLGLRSGIWKKWNKLGWYPVVVASNITFRKSLMPWQSFDIESRVIGWDDQAFYFEQRFVVAEGTGGWDGHRPYLPQWVKDWSVSSALPKGKEAAPSLWHD